MKIVLVEDDYTHTIAAQGDGLFDVSPIASKRPTEVAFHPNYQVVKFGSHTRQRFAA
ncbi:hypothetical protein [Hydrogenophaga sp.]|uniref:hypothetical protein n=1 Tax=Hydrogenophaga sp. TaxID=1904254 RepID=UPI002FCBCA7D